MFVVLTYTSDFIVYFVRALHDDLSKIDILMSAVGRHDISSKK